MRIAVAMINCNRRDGSARAVNEVVERLAARGHEVHLYAREAEDLDLSAIRWHRIPGPNWPEIADFYSYHRTVNFLLRGHNYDIVHSIGCNTIRANVVTIQNVQPAKVKIMRRFAAHERVSPPRRFTRWLYLTTTTAVEKKLYAHRPGKPPVMFLPVSRGVEKELRDHYDLGPSPVRIVPNAADTTVFHPITGAERALWRAANGLKDDDIVCIFSGGEWARKGLDSAIRALGKIPDPRVKLFVAGDDADRGRFKAMTVECGAANRIVFGGFRKDIATAMGASDLFLFPSHYEAFSLATIEAAACGLPVVATKINGTEDFIEPGKNGDFITHDPENIANVLAPLARNGILRRSMGETGRDIVERKYTWDRVAAMTEEAYREALERKS